MRRLVAIVILLLVLFVPVIEAKNRPGPAVTAPTYTNPYLRTPNYTLNISTIPYDQINPSKVTAAQLYAYDTVLPGPAPVRLDPRTCEGQIATCYQIVAHNYTRTITYGANRTNVGSYTFPFRRVRFLTCVGDDQKCVAQARGCFCPDVVPLEPIEFLGTDKCGDTQHQCEVVPGFVTLCTGNITSCRERYGNCGCGRYASCNVMDLHSCHTSLEDIIGCRSALPDCLKKYDACACGGTAFSEYTPSCGEARHRCSLGFVNITCEGSFKACALQYDRCSCGT